jgi:phage terminase large subunit-like protein
LIIIGSPNYASFLCRCCIDPVVTSKEGSDDRGIIVGGNGISEHGYILGECTLHDTPRKCAEAAITSYNIHEANLIVGEK